MAEKAASGPHVTPKWTWTVAAIVLAGLLVWLVRGDLAQVRWAQTLSSQGSPAPSAEISSPTGYAGGQRHFLGTHERGDTFRWIAATQRFLAGETLPKATYDEDTVPTGRARLTPHAYTVWLGLHAWLLHAVFGTPVGVAAEQVALWEPVISHVLAFLAVVLFVGRRFGPWFALGASAFLVLYPPFFAQFLPGALSPRTWALLLAAYVIARCLPGATRETQPSPLSVGTALCAALSVWLEPAFGFPAVLIVGFAAAFLPTTPGASRRVLVWAATGGAVLLAASLIDRIPWDVSVSELRYVHPLYACAWLGVGLLAGACHRPQKTLWLCAGALLVGPLVYAQFRYAFPGWLYTGAAMRRLTSLDETLVFDHALAWAGQSGASEIVLVLLPLCAACVVAVLPLVRPPPVDPRETAPAPRRAALQRAVVVLAIAVLALFKLRWGVVAGLLALPLLAGMGLAARPFARWTLAGAGGAFVFALLLWAKALPPSFARPTDTTPSRGVDVEALVHRHFAHWLSSHRGGQEVLALAPPDLSDSLVFHGGLRVLMSTAWQSFLGQVAASRILSAPESSEVEAVLQSRSITHVILPSWDPVLPRFVQPAPEGKDTFHARLLRWIHPAFLRAVPFKLPKSAGFMDQKLAVFRVVSTQDEALALSRLAEYFVEMERPEPALLAAKVLADAYPDDPNAAIARALVYAHVNDRGEFERLLSRLSSEVEAGNTPYTWDRRVQRAIALALGRRREAARREIAACAAGADAAGLLELTPLQAHRFASLLRRFQVDLPDEALNELLSSLSSEYRQAPATSG